MSDRLILLIDFIGSAVGDVSASGLLILVGCSSPPILALEQGTSRLHQLGRYEPIRRTNQETLRFRAEREAVFAPFLLNRITHQLPHADEPGRHGLKR